jgi:hypothetical protein
MRRGTSLLLAAMAMMGIGSGASGAPVPEGNRRRRDQPAEPQGHAGYAPSAPHRRYYGSLREAGPARHAKGRPIPKAVIKAWKQLCHTMDSGARTRARFRAAARYQTRLSAWA